MKEYEEEHEKKVSIEKLTAPWVEPSAYEKIHQFTVLCCHDAFIEINGGILLVVRKRAPLKGMLWPLGGAVKRGVPIIESLKRKVMDEAGIKIKDIKYLGNGRTFLQTDPFGHGKGTDTINFAYFARGVGKLRLDGFHEKPLIVKPEGYTLKFKSGLHPYVKDFMDKAMELI